MVTQFISSKEIIARVDNNFTIDFSDWIHSAPLWIADALALIQTTMVWESTTTDVEITGHVGLLPCNIKALRGVVYNKERLYTTTKMYNSLLDSVGLFSSEHSYELSGNRNIITTFEEGTITVIYYRPMVEYWKEHNVYLPIIPDNMVLIEAIKWFILKRLLEKGAKHPIFSLRESNVYINPAMAWEQYSRKAKNSLNLFTPDQRTLASQILRTFITDLNFSAKQVDSTQTLVYSNITLQS